MLRRTACLQRIASEGPMDPTADTLAKLSRAHLLAVPFENLDAILGEEILLTTGVDEGPIAKTRKDSPMPSPDGTGRSRPVQLLGLGGSLRPESNSLIALEDALRLASEAGAETALVSVRDLALPVYDPTLSADEQPAALGRFLDQVRAADAFIFCSPTYHGTVSGAVKNVLDALNGLARDQPRYLGGKPVGLMALGGGSAMNTINALAHATRALNGLAAITIVTVPGAAIGVANRRVTDEAVRARLATMVDEVLDLASDLQRLEASTLPRVGV